MAPSLFFTEVLRYRQECTSNCPRQRGNQLASSMVMDLDQRLRAAVALVLAMGLATLGGGAAATAAALPFRAACRRASVSAAFGASTGAPPGAGAAAPGLPPSFF